MTFDEIVTKQGYWYRVRETHQLTASVEILYVFLFQSPTQPVRNLPPVRSSNIRSAPNPDRRQRRQSLAALMMSNAVSQLRRRRSQDAVSKDAIDASTSQSSPCSRATSGSAQTPSCGQRRRFSLAVMATSSGRLGSGKLTTRTTATAL